MARLYDFAEQRPVVISGIADFERHYGPINAEVVATLGRSLAPASRSGTLRITEVDEDAFATFLGGPAFPADPPPATLSWGLSIKASQALRTPCPRFWRHPLRWLRWNPFLTGILLTKVQLNDVRITAEDGEEIVSWEVEG